MGATTKRLSGNSAKNSSDKILGALSKAEIKTLLEDCANLPNPLATVVSAGRTPHTNWRDESPHFERWLGKWRRLFTFQEEGADGKLRTLEIPREQLERFVPKVRATLCRIWTEQDLRQRDWYFYRIRDAYQQMIMRAENPWLLDTTDKQAPERIEQVSRGRGDNPGQRARFLEEWTGASLIEDAPRICPFEAAVYWLQLNPALMLYCGEPTCSAPYFFRPEAAKKQKFCSPECADPARRQAKLRYWHNTPTSPKNRPKRKPGKKQSHSR